jgi:hypothetical protein
MFCCYRCAGFAGGVLLNRAALAVDEVANLALSSRRRNFCFLNLLNLALSPFCDDICPSSSNLFVTQRVEDKSVRCSIRQATDGRCETQGTMRRNPLQRLRVRLLGLPPGCRQNVLRHARSILYFSKDLPCRCGLRNLAQRSGVARFPRNGDLSTIRANIALKTRKAGFCRHHPKTRLIHRCTVVMLPSEAKNQPRADSSIGEARRAL